MLLCQLLLILLGEGLGYILLLVSQKAVLVKIHKLFCLVLDQSSIKRDGLGEIEYVEILLDKEIYFLRYKQKTERLF